MLYTLYMVQYSRMATTDFFSRGVKGVEKYFRASLIRPECAWTVAATHTLAFGIRIVIIVIIITVSIRVCTYVRTHTAGHSEDNNDNIIFHRRPTYMYTSKHARDAILSLVNRRRRRITNRLHHVFVGPIQKQKRKNK